ncbi:hypothetical protein FJR38_20430 [Anabaena sp. UHCC 0253]|uniref:hypothetical protein n=1 Tax=Anabaena sp. UHCC 0253 TaxID=2590019 RepID=UPI001445B629|nr:hypothetical protein [Anabaena sp. UHCC 0253]MTJ54862.1 hypothetical protein [Anabaena sp. UHCC 0253]
MITLSSLNEVANYLEEHENSKRIKKLIFCACKNIWENDQDTLDRFELTKLIRELCNLNPTIDNLNSTLSNVVNTLNKPGEYALVANLIVNEIQKLYLNSEEATGILSPSDQEEATGLLLNQPIQKKSIISEPEKISANYIKPSQYNYFDLRQNLMKYTNPLRAKIVIFSALDHKFTFNQEDWFKLRTEELDSLLQRLSVSCPTISELESKLNTAVKSLGKIDENIQAAGAIIQCMRSLYSKISVSTNPYQLLNNNSSPETRPLVNTNNPILFTEVDDYIYEDDDHEASTCQFIVPPIENMKNQQ